MSIKRSKRPRWFPALWLVISGALLALDFASGPFVGFPIVYIIPVGLAARYSGRGWGIGVALLLSLTRFGFIFWWAEPWSLGVSIVNLAIRLVILVGAAVLIDRLVRQAAEIRVLRGVLPTCCVCKKIRTQSKQWVPIEAYISAESEATFSHSFCPDCGREQYGELWPEQESAPKKQP